MPTKQDKQRAPDISEHAWEAANVILHCWEDWDQEAGENAQSAQSFDEYLNSMEWQIAAVVQGAINEASKQKANA